MRLSKKIQKFFNDTFKEKDYYTFLESLSTLDNRYHTIIIRMDMISLTELIQKVRLLSFLILSSIFKYKNIATRHFEESENGFLIIRSYQDDKYQMNITLFKDSGIMQINILEMKLLAHLIYLLNEQGVGNTFYLSPIIKKILDNHYKRERKAKLSTMKVYIRKFTNNGYLKKEPGHYILLKPIPTDLTNIILRTWK